MNTLNGMIGNALDILGVSRRNVERWLRADGNINQKYRALSAWSSGVITNKTKRQDALSQIHQLLGPPEPPKQSKPIEVRQCKYRGRESGYAQCVEGCQGVQLKVFKCEVHGECTIAKKGKGVPAVCGMSGERCTDFFLKVDPVQQPAQQQQAVATLPTVVIPAPIVPVPTPAPRIEAPTLTWAVGVTTVPVRIETHLPKTLATLDNAGFVKPWLFIDGTADYSHFNNSVAGMTYRSTPARVHGNWFLGLHELWVRYPLADRYAMFQDDVTLLKNVRQFVEATKYPDRGYLNLYTMINERYYAQQKNPNVKGWVQSTQRGKGALALVFDRLAVETLLTSRHMVMRPVPSDKSDLECLRGGFWYRGQKTVDGGIVESLSAKAGIREYVHLPTLCQHTGLKSSIHEVGREGLRHPLAVEFAGEGFDAMQLIGA